MNIIKLIIVKLKRKWILLPVKIGPLKMDIKYQSKLAPLYSKLCNWNAYIQKFILINAA